LQIQDFENKIAEIQAHTGKLSTECAEIQQGMADNEQARQDAQEIRDKELKSFESEQTDMVDGISSMDGAIETLSAVGGDQTALIKMKDSESVFRGRKSLLRLKATVKEAMSAMNVLLSHKEKQTFESFLQAPGGDYSAQSGEIVGILKNMRDTFKQNLASIRAAEKTASEAHAKFMSIKEEEFETMKVGFDDKQKQLGDNDEELAGQREMLEETQAELASDEEFLAKLLVMCAKKAKEFEERKMMRANEEAAVSKAIAILDSDAAFASFGKVKATKGGGGEGPPGEGPPGEGPPGEFIQISSIKGAKYQQLAMLRSNIIQLLSKAARRTRSLKIARIVTMLQADNPFDSVLKEIDAMKAVIDEEEKADVENKEWCESERDENEKNKATAEDNIRSLEETINTLDDEINNPETGLKAKIAMTEGDIQKNHDDQATETADRQAENKIYQQNIKNIVAAEELLKKAIKVLKAYYDQFNKEFLQEDPKGPDTWEGDYKGQSEQGGEVISTLEFILEETAAEQKDTHTKENEAQHDFEDAMADLKKEQATLEEALAKYQLELAKTEKALAESKDELAKTQAELKSIEKYLLKIKPGCDYIAENYETRKKNRNLEKDALDKAIELLKGTPAYKKAVFEAEQEKLGDCKDVCNEEGRDHAKCEACLAGTSVPGYCAGHKGTPGC